MWLRAKHRAEKCGVHFSISVSDIAIPEACPILGIVLIPYGESRDTSPSLDRIIEEKGYTPDNIRVISNRANRIKSDASVEELEKIVRYMKEKA